MYFNGVLRGGNVNLYVIIILSPSWICDWVTLQLSCGILTKACRGGGVIPTVWIRNRKLEVERLPQRNAACLSSLFVQTHAHSQLIYISL